MSQAAGTQGQGVARRPEPSHDDAPALIRTALQAAFRWWRVGRHYHPERRYMRG